MEVTLAGCKMPAHHSENFEGMIDFGHSSGSFRKTQHSAIIMFHNCAWGTLSWIRNRLIVVQIKNGRNKIVSQGGCDCPLLSSNEM